MQTERRKYRRYNVKENAFAVITQDPVRLVPILDVAMGGLGIYVNDEAKWINSSTKLEIMVADCSFYLDSVPFEIISNLRAFSAASSNMLDGRRYSLKFGNLRPVQKARLKYFIRRYTHGGSKFQFLHKFSKLLGRTWTNKYTQQSCNLGIWQGLH